MMPSQRVPRRWEPGRLFARALCAIFAAIGVLPLALTLLVSSSPLTRSSYHADADFARLKAARAGQVG